MTRRFNPGVLIQSTIAEIRKEKNDSQLWEDFMQSKAELLDDLFQDYLIELAYHKLHGSKAVLSQSVIDLPIPSHAKNILITNGITTVRELISHSVFELSHLPGFGQKSLSIIIDYLTRVGFELSSGPYNTK